MLTSRHCFLRVHTTQRRHTGPRGSTHTLHASPPALLHPRTEHPARSCRPGLLAGQPQLMVAAGSDTSALGAPRCLHTHPPACSALPARTSAAPRRAAACAAPCLRTAPHRLRSAMHRAVAPRRSGGDKVCGGGAGCGRCGAGQAARSLARCMPDVWMNCSRRQLRAGAGV